MMISNSRVDLNMHVYRHVEVVKFQDQRKQNKITPQNKPRLETPGTQLTAPVRVPQDAYCWLVLCSELPLQQP